MAKTRKWIVTGEVTISVLTEVEAASEAEAKSIANERGMMSFCHKCARGNPSEEWSTSGELDGEPRKIEAEEA